MLAERFDFRLNVATARLDWRREMAAVDRVEFRASIQPRPTEEAVSGADCVVTDTWVSMGDEAAKANRRNLLKPYQVNARLMAGASHDAIFMHCLRPIIGE